MESIVTLWRQRNRKPSPQPSDLPFALIPWEVECGRMWRGLEHAPVLDKVTLVLNHFFAPVYYCAVHFLFTICPSLCVSF